MTNITEKEQEKQEPAEDRVLTLHERLVKIQQTLNAPKNQVNRFGNYNYRSCEDILGAVKPLLNGLSLIIYDEVVQVGERYYVKATVRLNDGDMSIEATAYARESAEKKGMDSAQVTGATSSYARKYALNGLFAIDDTRDADTMDNRAEEAHKPSQSIDPEWMEGADSGEGREYERPPTEESATSRTCNIHHVEMLKGVSKTKFNKDGTPKTYFSHKVNGEMCFGS